MIVVSGTIRIPCKNVISRYALVIEVSVPSGRPDASAWSIMWFSSLTPIESIAGSESFASVLKRSSRRFSSGV